LGNGASSPRWRHHLSDNKSNTHGEHEDGDYDRWNDLADDFGVRANEGPSARAPRRITQSQASVGEQAK
jgi:hypothetical protein